MNTKQKIKYWTSIIEACEKDNLPVNKWCQANKINTSSYYRWRNYIRRKQSDYVVSFSPVEVIDTRSTDVTITINGVTINFDKTLLSDVLKAIQ